MRRRDRPVPRSQQAIDTADLGLATAVNLRQHFCDPELLCVKGKALALLGHHHQARTTLEEGRGLAETLGAASAGLDAAVALVPLVRADDPGRAERELSAGLAGMGDGADTRAQRDARRLLAEVRVNN